LAADDDDDDYALLIEECRPGTTLLDDPAPAEDRLVTAAGVLHRLWSAPVPDDAPFERVADVCAEWAQLLRRRMEELSPPIDPGLVAAGAALLESLPASATRSVVVHGDYNPTNLLRAEREPWLAIDAKPMVGDPGYDPLSLVLQVGDPIAEGLVVPRYALVADVLGEPVDRLLAWSVARLVESALWHASRGEDPAATMADARVLADAAGL
jgi:streptomycin 6-kinase